MESNAASGLPTIPPIPQEPPFIDLSQYTDKTERKAAEKEQSRLLKEYRRAVKERNSLMKKIAKAEQHVAKENRTPAAIQSQTETVSNGPEAISLDEGIETMQLGPQTPVHDLNSPSPYSNYVFSRSTILAQPHPDDRSTMTDSSATSMNTSYAESTEALSPQGSHDTTSNDPTRTAPTKKKRYKKFCMLPPKDANGNPDPTWIRVFMENVDEVVAHTSLFFMSETYERLVGDVAARIEDWVRENDSVRLVREMEGLR
jgi:hypothetical protein